ncbi:MAG: hypothetical protein WDO24_15000 [Pseudomonadota bacterium]
MQEKIRAIGVVPGGGSAAAFAAFIRSEIDKWKPVVERRGWSRNRIAAIRCGMPPVTA